MSTQTDVLTALSTQDNVRDSMNRLPKIFALPLTMLTGQPHTGQRPIRFTPTTHLVNATLSMLTGVAISTAALAAGGWWLALLLPGWAMTLHGMRNLRMMVFHQCAHRNMWARRAPDALVGRVIAGLLMVQHFERYSVEHVSDHHARHHMTLRDPTVQAFLVSLELAPGMTRRQMWRRLTAKLVSPRFHARFLVARVRSYFHDANGWERAAVLTGVAVAAGLATWLHGWLFLLVAWVLPLTLFYQVSNTLRLCVKHTFPPPSVTKRLGKEYFGSLTNAIFLGERPPLGRASTLRGFLDWTRWWLRMLLVHFPARYLVLTGDTVCHDFHHRHPMTRDWANYIFARARDIESPAPGWPAYRHVWGLAPAIDTVFASLAAGDPTEYSRQRLAEINHRELFAAFDD
jgi:fatty acid desaturase